jgi:dUTP pyrophosphatase
LSFNHGICVTGGIGTIDSDYRGEIKIGLINTSDKNYTVNHGDRIAQIVFVKIERASIKIVEELDETKRSSGGFGHTGN